ncbi:MAG: ADP-ribosylglycohydrolase family protein [Lachnospiraceae bacterium]|nr:ADP-ribosylglycohydrolase family protein [Lachnospiraceae bacterium]
METKRLFPAEWIEKIYAGWLAKVIGIRLGAPVEGWTRKRIAETYGDQTGYLKEYRRFAADDDSNGPMFFVRALEDSGKSADDLSSQDVAEAVLNYVPAGHGFFWWGGYGISTEHTAYENLSAGIPAPMSGSILMNGATAAEQIGGQIFIDSWGLITPGNADLAAKLAREAASVTHDGEGVNGGIFVAVCISTAFVERDIHRILRKGFSYLPPESTYRRVGEEIMRFYDEHPDSWEKCMEHIEACHGYDRYPGNCHIIPNAAVMVLSLLYGEGDFSKTLQICCRCGWDTDCNVGNVASIMGVCCGIQAIGDGWRKPLNDFLAASSVIGSLNNTDIPGTADRLVRLAAMIRGEALPEEWSCCMEKHPVSCHFAYPGSTHAMEAYRRDEGKPAGERIPEEVKNTDRFGSAGGRSLCAVLKEEHRGQRLYLGRRTYLFPDDFTDDRYRPAFSPLVYAGQTLTARVRTEHVSGKSEDSGETGCRIRVRMYIYCGRSETYVYGESKAISPGAWHGLSWKIPELDGRLITEIGIAAEEITDRGNCPGAKDGRGDVCLFLDCLKADGRAAYQVDFSKERTENWSVFQQEVSQFTCLKGHVFLEKGKMHLSCADFGETYTGGYDWRDYQVETSICPLTGEHHYLSFRVQGGVRSYFAGLGPGGMLELCKKTREGITCLGSTPLPWRHGETYEVTVTVSGNRLRVRSCGRTLEAVDEDAPYLYGCIGFRTQAGSHLCSEGFSVKAAETQEDGQ